MPHVELQAENPPLIAAPLDVCPGCGQDSFTAVVDEDTVNFLCLACWRCWHIALGWVSLVDPHTCRECRNRARCLGGSDV